MSRNSHWRLFCKAVLKNFCNIHRKKPELEYLFQDSGHLLSSINKNSHTCLKYIFLFFCLIFLKT